MGTFIAYREWASAKEWGGWWGQVGSRRQTKSKHSNTKGSAVPSVGNKYILAQLTGKARSAICISLAPQAVLLMPLRGHKGHEMHPSGLIASKKSRL